MDVRQPGQATFKPSSWQGPVPQEPDSEDTPLARCTLHVQAPTAFIENGTHNRKPEAESAGLGRVQRLLDPLEIRLCDADPRVRDGDLDDPLEALARDRRGSPLGHGVERVPNQVSEDELELGFIRPHRRERRREPGFHFDLRDPRMRFEGLGDTMGDVGWTKAGAGILAKFASVVITPSARSTCLSIRFRCSTCFSGVGSRALSR